MSALNQKLIDWLQIDQSQPFSSLGPAAIPDEAEAGFDAVGFRW